MNGQERERENEAILVHINQQSPSTGFSKLATFIDFIPILFFRFFILCRSFCTSSSATTSRRVSLCPPSWRVGPLHFFYFSCTVIEKETTRHLWHTQPTKKKKINKKSKKESKHLTTPLTNRWRHHHDQANFFLIDKNSTTIVLWKRRHCWIIIALLRLYHGERDLVRC